MERQRQVIAQLPTAVRDYVHFASCLSSSSTIIFHLLSRLLLLHQPHHYC